DVLVRDLHTHVARLLLALGLLDEQRDRLILDRGVVRGAGLRALALLRLEAAARLLHQLVERRLLNVLTADDCDVPAVEALGTASATACEERRDDDEREDEACCFQRESFQRKTPAQAAWRAAIIASTRPSASLNSSCLNVTSRCPVLYTAV